MAKKPSLVIALGGNAISKPGVRGSINEQFYSTSESMEHVADLIAGGYGRILITHGNGPQVGNAILRSELATKYTYTLPMDICVADTQGGMGYMIQQVLQNNLRKRKKKITKNIITLITQVVVDPSDKAFENPTKPVGKFYTRKEASDLEAGRKWTMKQDANRGFRRVVPSPKPTDIREKNSIKALFDAGHVVICGGGGGVPVGLNRHGNYYGIEAVIDKDLTTALIAKLIEADIMIILTGIENVCTGFGTKKKKAIHKIKSKELKQHLDNGEFAEGSMKPKIEAALDFLAKGGKKAIITSIPKCLEALKGKSGTIITS